MSEVIIFQDKTVLITRTLIRIGSRSYPVNAIGSVDVLKPDRSKPTAFAIASAIVGVLMALGGSTGAPLIVAAVAALVFGSQAWNSPSVLVIRTGSGDQQALTSTSLDYLAKVREAIEQAVISRG